MFGSLIPKMIKLVTFSTPNFSTSLKLLKQSARHYGIDNIYSYTPADLKKTPFYRVNKYILDQPRGAGYWLWKPYFLLQTLKSSQPGDIVIYSDAGIEFVASPQKLYPLARKHQSLFFREGGESLNNRYTKRDCFIINHADSPEFWQGPQVLASIHLHLVCSETINFISHWVACCANPYSLTDLPNICNQPNLPEFEDHRHDQSVLSILIQQYSYPLHRDPSQYGQPLINDPRYQTSNYGIIINHHRRRQASLVNRLRRLIHL